MSCTHPNFDEFVETIARLRAPDGCPWDKEQTHLSIAPNMIEEACEAVEAIEDEDVSHLREELGDVLLQVVLQSQIAADEGEFTIDDVCAEVNAKMIRRHPHVFGDAEAGNANDVLAVWDQIKLKEKQDAGVADKATSLLDGVPKAFPALTQAQKISRKAASVGFEWDSVDDVWQKVEEEIVELKEAYAQAPKDHSGKLIEGAGSKGDGGKGDSDAEAGNTVTNTTNSSITKEDVELELGDVLFSLVNVARKMGLNSENALRATCTKFRKRWSFMEDEARKEGRSIADLSQPELESLWDKSKRSV